MRREATIRILLAEDNPVDVFLVRRALDSHAVRHNLMVVKNGEEAIRFLDQAANGPRDGVPELILLDLNLPRVEGSQILAYIRGIAFFARTPVIILTSSDSARDRESVLSLGANRFFRKPTDLHSFMELGKIVEDTLNEDQPGGLPG